MIKHGRWIIIAALAVALLGLAACGGSDDGGSDAEAGNSRGGDATGPVVGGPPDDYVPWECSLCDCRRFSGEGALCSRPSCRHSWKDHMRPPQGP